MNEMKFGKHTVEISNPDKVLFPETNITKMDLAKYYEKISDNILPHIKNRPITMHRYPNGINKKNFYQKNSSDFFPDWIKTERIKKKEGGSYDAPVCGNTATLVYLANLASITPHVWLSKIDALNKPDRIIFDLDPPKGNFDIVKFGAKKIKEFCEDGLNITPYIMTTGSKGLHLVIPIKAENDFDNVRDAAQLIAKHLSNQYPEKLTLEVRKEKREGRLFLDTARNAFGQTAVAPYSVRARENAPVAVPIDWKELSNLNGAQQYNIKNIFRRLSQKEDPWNNIERKRKTLKKIRKELKKLK